jgi:hypothetical protein
MKIHPIQIFIFLMLILPFEVGAYTDEDCIKCHDRTGEGSALKMSVEQFNRSIHADEAACQNCHTNVVDDDHQEVAGSGAVNCRQCHDQENRHAMGATDNRPKCFNCHTRHNTHSKDDPQASVHPDRLEQTCRACHPAQSGTAGYFTWFTSVQIASHPKQDFSQIYTGENCLGCHQGQAAHGETAPINDQNCHTCHFDDDGQNKLWGVIHPDAQLETQPGVFAAAVTYQLVLATMVFGGFCWLIRHFSGRKE